jgi:pimeloyl-ACP methyl ester carboxylesterase
MPEFWYDGDGVRLYAVEDGRGPVVIMLHGGGGDHRACPSVAAPLSARYRVITPVCAAAADRGAPIRSHGIGLPMTLGL